MKPYLVPAGEGSAEFIEKKSRFIGNIFPVESTGQAADIVKDFQKRLWDASHNVWAYVLADGVMRFSDDGEPQGTAGLPTLDVLKKEEVTNVLCVTTRYFGGTLLGAGGLVRAYSHACKIALDSAGIAQMTPYALARAVCPYPFLDSLRRLYEPLGAEESDVQYAEHVILNIVLPVENFGEFEAGVVELSSGTVRPELAGEKMFAKRLR